MNVRGGSTDRKTSINRRANYQTLPFVVGTTTPKSDDATAPRYHRPPFPAQLAEAHKVLLSVFGIDSLRPGQRVAVENTLKGKSQIIIMATGGGKSLCYQLPAVVLGGVTLVVSPLIALMSDQVRRLTSANVRAAALCSSNGARRNADIVRALGSDATAPTLLYVTPESLRTDRLRAAVTALHERGRLTSFAIDEAHCLSSWGHDFRPAYRTLSWLTRSFPDVPCAACTATATPKVVEDVRESLGLKKNVPVYKGGFNRANIRYEVRYKDVLNSSTPNGAVSDLVCVVREQHERARSLSTTCSGIVYTHRKADTVSLARTISSRCPGVVAAPYHAGLPVAERTNTQRQWTFGETHVVVATVAFGMGIDKADVRYVLHWNMSKTLEGFYQESGRAGRDGKESVSVAYFTREDARSFSFLIRQNKDEVATKRNLEALEAVVSYCEGAECRRRSLCKHFGEEINPKTVCKKTCDVCADPKKVERLVELSKVAKDVSVGVGKLKSAPKFNNKKSEQGERSDDEDDAENDDWGDSTATKGGDGPLFDDGNDNDAKKRPITTSEFVRASDVLSKFEVLECQQGKKNGFVTFKPKNDPKPKHKPKKNSLRKMLARFGGDKEDEEEEGEKRLRRFRSCAGVVVPEHLRSQMPDPLERFAKKKTDKTIGLLDAKSNGDVASEIDRLKRDLAAMKEKKKNTTRRMNAVSAAIKTRLRTDVTDLSIPFAPTLSFESGGRKKKR